MKASNRSDATAGAGRRPARDPKQLGQQVLRELERLAELFKQNQQVPPDEVPLLPGYLQAALHDLFTRISAGDLQGVAAARSGLREARRHVQRAMPEAEHPYREGVRFADFVIRALEVADQALDAARVEVDLRAVSSKSKRQVLGALYHAPGSQFLRAGQVLELIPASERRISKERITQILAELYRLDLLVRMIRPARGGQTNFYQLSPNGRDTCERLLLASIDTRSDQADEKSGEGSSLGRESVSTFQPPSVWKHRIVPRSDQAADNRSSNTLRPRPGHQTH